MKFIADENIRMLNGLTGKDIPGAFTFVLTKGKSIIVSILIETPIWHKYKSFEILSREK